LRSSHLPRRDLNKPPFDPAELLGDDLNDFDDLESDEED